MDETVYQCPECNFNADNLDELDSHIIENHSNEINPLNGNIVKSNLVKSTNSNTNGNNKLANSNLITHNMNNKNYLNGFKNQTNTEITIVRDEDDEDEANGDHDEDNDRGYNDNDDTENQNTNQDTNEDEDEDEDFFNERTNNSKPNNNNSHHRQNYQNDVDIDENGYEINENNEENEIVEEEEDFFGNNQVEDENEENDNENENIYQNNYNDSSVSQVHRQHSQQQQQHQQQRNLQQPQHLQQSLQQRQAQIKNRPTNITTFRPIKANNQNTMASIQAAAAVIQQNGGTVINSDNHYERQYACKRCDFFTNNPRAVLYHRKEFHLEKINVHECQYCQYASQYSGKVERHTLLRHKIDINSSKFLNKSINNSKLDETQNHDPADRSINSANQTLLGNIKSDNTSMNNTSLLNNSQSNSNNQIAKFQCNKCPCKYKRSSDLTKHLRLKHSINPNSLNDYLKMSNSRPQDMDDIQHDNEDYENNNNDTSNSQFNNQYQQQSNNNLNTSLNRSYLNRNFNQIQKKIINEQQTNIIETNNAQIQQQKQQQQQQQQQQQIINPNTFQCPYCTYYASLENSNEYLLHVKDHLCGKTFRCVLCNSVYKYRGDCVVHLKRKHQKADMIAHSYVDKFNLDNLEIHDIYGLLKPKEIDEPENEEKLFGCSYCDYKANYKGDVYKHQTRRHPGTVKSVLSLANQNSTILSNCSNQSSENNSVNNSFNMTNSNANNLNNTQNNNNNNNNQSNYDDGDCYIEENDEQEKEMNGGSSNYYINGQKLNVNNQDPNDPNDPNEIIINDEDDDEENYMNEMNEMNDNNNDLEDEDDEDFFNERNNNGQDNSQDYNETDEFNDYQDYNDPDGLNLNNDMTEEEKLAQIRSHIQDYQRNRYQCKFCAFVAKNHAKLQLHLATHYNLKRFMCPICKRRANFKWDIQKHLRKIHNDHQSEVICLSENDARKSINNYIETKPYTNTSANAIIYANSLEKIVETNKISNDNSNHSNTIDGSNGSNLSSPQKSNSLHALPQFKFAASSARPNPILGLSERKYKCSLCMRTSKWQWDIKKHLRTVHKGREGDVIILDEKDLVNKQLNQNHHEHLVAYQASNLNSSLPLNIKSNQSSPLIYNGVNLNQTTIGSDTTGNKKFRCTICPYRSNWKADMYRHLRKRHTIAQPKIEDVIVLTPDEAASTLEEYERLHGINIRKRARFDDVYRPTISNSFNQGSNDGFSSDQNIESKRFKNDSASVISTSESNEPNQYTTQMEDDINDSESHETLNTNMESSNDNHGYDSDQINGNGANGGVERLPVSIAELNIKPYKCLKCGFRSDRKSDTLRHIRVKHALQPLQAFKFLRILSIKEASETIDQYESTRLYKKVKPNNRDYALINTLVQKTSQNQDPSSALSNLKLLTKGHAQTQQQQTPQTQPQQQVQQHNQLNSQFIKTNPVQIHRPNPLNSQYSTRSNVGLNTSLPINLNGNGSPNKQPVMQKSIIDEKLKTMNTQDHSLKENKMNVHLNENIKNNKKSSIDYFKCPFCSFKHMSRVVMKKHLSTHYFGNQMQSNPIYKCSLCNFKSEWQYTCKKHILTTHLASGAVANVIKLTNLEEKKIKKKEKKKTLKIIIKPIKPSIDQENIEENEEAQEIDQNEIQDKLNGNNGIVNKYSYFNNQENDEYINYDDHDDSIVDDHVDMHQQKQIQKIEPHDEENDKKNLSLNQTLDDDKTPESVILTGYDGKQFTAHYLVSNSSVSFNGNTSNSGAGLNGMLAQKKKMFFCQTCPYKTNNYCNLKQHLLQHKFRDGFFKCRYCPYYVSMIRLLKQHEILHSEYAPRENCSLNNSLNTSIQSPLKHGVNSNQTTGSITNHLQHQQQHQIKNSNYNHKQ